MTTYCNANQEQGQELAASKTLCEGQEAAILAFFRTWWLKPHLSTGAGDPVVRLPERIKRTLRSREDGHGVVEHSQAWGKLLDWLKGGVCR